MTRRCVCILGDEISLGEGCQKGRGYADRVKQTLQPHGVDLLNWSREEQTATRCATESLEEFQGQLLEVSQTSSQVFVVLALGTHDRVYLVDMLEQAMEMLVRVCRQADAKPIVLQLVPDDLDMIIAQEHGCAFVPAPPSVIRQYQQAPNSPFFPSADAHKDIARALCACLEGELRLPLAEPAHQDDSEETLHVGNRPRAVTPHHSKAHNGGSLEGVWMHKDDPNLIEMIQGNIIMSADGTTTQLHAGGSGNTFFIESGGQRIDAQVRGHELHWSDGDIWCMVEDDGAPTLDRAPERKKKGDLKSLKKAWEAAEEAVNRTKEEEGKQELEREREYLTNERRRLEQERRRFEEGNQSLHEETEKVSAMRVS